MAVFTLGTGFDGQTELSKPGVCDESLGHLELLMENLPPG